MADTTNTTDSLAAPDLNVKMIYGTCSQPVDLTYTSYTPPSAVTIDINTTPVTDGKNVAYLSSLINQIADKKLVIDAKAQVTDGTNQAPIDLKYDTDGKKFGEGTAFLQ